MPFKYSCTHHVAHSKTCKMAYTTQQQLEISDQLCYGQLLRNDTACAVWRQAVPMQMLEPHTVAASTPSHCVPHLPASIRIDALLQ